MRIPFLKHTALALLFTAGLTLTSCKDHDSENETNTDTETEMLDSEGTEAGTEVDTVNNPDGESEDSKPAGDQVP
jgi:hypothetical protein